MAIASSASADPLAPQPFVHRSRLDGSWSDGEARSFGLHPDLAVDAEDHLLGVYLAGDPRGADVARDVNSVFFVRSEDRGASWSRPIRIMRAGDLMAFDPRITLDGTGRLHVIWARDTTGDQFPDVIQHSHSLMGECWSKPVDVAQTLTGMPGSPEVVGDNRGGIHVVYQLSRGGPLTGPFQAIYVYWDGTEWMEPIQLFGSDLAGQVIGLARGTDGTVHLALWAEIDGVRGIHYATGPPQ